PRRPPRAVGLEVPVWAGVTYFPRRFVTYSPAEVNFGLPFFQQGPTGGKGAFVTEVQASIPYCGKSFWHCQFFVGHDKIRMDYIYQHPFSRALAPCWEKGGSALAPGE
ncbi:MAG: hypothetical protein JWQ02_1508, partial [Capsulimonas sp.]|nr:hypothetical protein [Capsulimonas sp.]